MTTGTSHVSLLLVTETIFLHLRSIDFKKTNKQLLQTYTKTIVLKRRDPPPVSQGYNYL